MSLSSSFGSVVFSTLLVNPGPLLGVVSHSSQWWLRSSLWRMGISTAPLACEGSGTMGLTILGASTRGERTGEWQGCIGTGLTRWNWWSSSSYASLISNLFLQRFSYPSTVLHHGRDVHPMWVKSFTKTLSSRVLVLSTMSKEDLGSS